MASISRERVPGRVATIMPRDLAEEQDWQVLTGRIRTLTTAVYDLEAAVTALQQRTPQPIYTIVQQATDYEFPAAFIRAEIDTTASNRTATLPLSDSLQGQLVNPAKSDNSVNTLTYVVQGTDALFVPAGADVLSAQWDSVVLIAVPGGWAIYASSV